jgi:hypothetical protein
MAEVTKGSDATARDYGIEVADVRIQRAHLPEKRGSCASSSPSARNFLASCDASGNGASEYEALGGESLALRSGKPVVPSLQSGA